MRVIGMDIHRVAAEVVCLLDGKLERLGRVQMLREKLEAFASQELTHDDHVVIEATGNAAAVAEVLAPFVETVVIANPRQVHLIARAKVKTDKIDASVLARLYASGFLPQVWVPDVQTQALRRQVTRRTQLVRQRSRLKNLIQSILHAHLAPPCPHGNLVGASGRRWLARQVLPADEHAAIERHLAVVSQVEMALKEVDADIARYALNDPSILRLMTLPGVDMTVAASVMSAIGDIKRFDAPTKLAAYLGLNPSTRQSGEGPAYHGKITKQGRGHARGMLVEAAWSAARAPGPLRAFFKRIAARRGNHIAAVATARKLAMVIWHMLSKNADYIWGRPSLLARKLRQAELRSGKPRQPAKPGAAYRYNKPEMRNGEKAAVERAECDYDALTRRWRKRKPQPRAEKNQPT